MNRPNGRATVPIVRPIAGRRGNGAPHGGGICGIIPACEMKGACNTETPFALPSGGGSIPAPFIPWAGHFF